MSLGETALGLRSSFLLRQRLNEYMAMPAFTCMLGWQVNGK